MERFVQYKKKTTGFGNLAEGKLIRALEGFQRRRKRRSDLFTSNREITEGSISPGITTGPEEGDNQRQSNQDNQIAPPPTIQEDRATRLAKWRMEKELQRKLQQMKQPVFRAGVYNHRLDSPIFLHQLNPTVKETKPASVAPRITRATAKRLAVKSSTANTPAVGAGSSRVKKAAGPLARGVKNLGKKTMPETSFAPNNHQFKAPDGLPPLPLFGQEALGNTTNDNTGKGAAAQLPIYFSPYVVTARGKRASRIEQLQILNSSVEKMEEEELKAKKENPSEEGERTVIYFKNITDEEVTRLKARCYDWLMVKSKPDLSEDAALIINQAIGQTTLLINKKIEQFRRLIKDCETGSGEKLVTCEDLQGFWDMIYMQIEDCDSRFDKLTKLQEKNWVEEEPKVKLTKPTLSKKPAVAAAKKNTSGGSSIRQMILAARKKKMESEANEKSPDVVIAESKKPLPVAEPSRLSSIKFNGGFFIVESPQKSITPRSAKKVSTMPQTPENLGVSKLRRSALSAMKISQILKPLEINAGSEVGSEPEITYVNCGQTPGKGILKKADVTQPVSCNKKSQNKVNFSKDEETTEFTRQNVNSEMHYVEDSSGDFIVKKKLEFLNLSSSESDLEEQHASCRQEIESSTRIPAVEDSEQDKETAATNQTDSKKRVTRQNRNSVLHKVNQLALSSATNIQSTEPETRSTSKSSFTKTGEHKENTKPENTEITKRRRSTRKSVKFSGEECTACMETKPVLPMTPGVKRKTSKNSEKESPKVENTEIKQSTATQSSSGNDLISWETPSQPPQRVRRSLRINRAQQ